MNQDKINADEIDWSSLSVEFAKLTIPQQLKPVGYWVIYPQGPMRTSFAMYHKPTAEQIANTEQLLGWGWRDEL
jgi:hypothetical protein